MEKKVRPVCVIGGDFHFTLQTLELASTAFREAVQTALYLNIPFVLNGDTLDGKALIRGEVANRLIHLIGEFPKLSLYINTGNHDMISEKGEDSSLDFLQAHATVIKYPRWIPELDSYIIPYHSDGQKLSAYLKTLPKDSRLIMHQGLQGASIGHYIQDKTSLPPEEFVDFRIISSHYHQKQDIRCGKTRKGWVGVFSYIGNPFSLSFGEADHGPKGYHILYEDGSLELVPLDLPKHQILETTTEHLFYKSTFPPKVSPNDKIWVKVTGPKTELDKLEKKTIAKQLGIENFKLDKIPLADTGGKVADTKPMTNMECLDMLIDGTAESTEEKLRMKALALELLS